MNTLFDDKLYINPNKCRHCKHRQRTQCNTKVFQYCGVRSSGRTENGLLKIKCKDFACRLFEKEVK